MDDYDNDIDEYDNYIDENEIADILIIPSNTTKENDNSDNEINSNSSENDNDNEIESDSKEIAEMNKKKRKMIKHQSLTTIKLLTIK